MASTTEFSAMFSAMAERQALLANRRASPRKEGASNVRPIVRPCVAVSREFGALGGAAARRIAQRLGFSFWDDELTEAMTEHSALTANWVARLDEHRQSMWNEFVHEALAGDGATQYRYMCQLKRVVREIGRDGAAVFVGRGIAFLLPRHQVLRIRVVCPESMRIRGYAAREGLELGEAASIVRMRERDRLAFVEQQFGVDAREPSHYDITINTSTISIEAAARVAESAYENRFGHPGQFALQKLSR